MIAFGNVGYLIHRVTQFPISPFDHSAILFVHVHHVHDVKLKYYEHIQAIIQVFVNKRPVVWPAVSML